MKNPLVTSAVGFLLFLPLTGCALLGGQSAWTELFDGQSLTGWHATNFGGEGDIEIKDGALIFQVGSPMTGLTRTSCSLPSEYELEVTAARMEGTDFFCGLTFPVDNAHLTLILGGWGGSVCGLSSIDGLDASNNATQTFMGFAQNRDYTALVRVTSEQVAVSIDGEPLCETKLASHKLGLRPEVEICAPLGIAAFQTVSRIRSIRWRPLP